MYIYIYVYVYNMLYFQDSHIWGSESVNIWGLTGELRKPALPGLQPARQGESKTNKDRILNHPLPSGYVKIAIENYHL